MRNATAVMILLFILFSCNTQKYKLEKKSYNNKSFDSAQKINKDGIIGQFEELNTDYYYFTIDGYTKTANFYISNSTYSPVIMTLYDYNTNIIKVINEPEINYTNEYSPDEDSNTNASSNNNTNENE